jgi:hypothetical protein
MQALQETEKGKSQNSKIYKAKGLDAATRLNSDYMLFRDFTCALGTLGSEPGLVDLAVDHEIAICADYIIAEFLPLVIQDPVAVGLLGKLLGVLGFLGLLHLVFQAAVVDAPPG